MEGRNQMKKLLIAILPLLLLSAAFAQTSSMIVSVDKYQPYPAEPGRYIDVWMRIQNNGNVEQKNVVLELTPKFPFSLDENEEGTETIPVLGAGQTVIRNFKVRVSENAVEGDNEFNFRYKSGSFAFVETANNIKVQTHDAIILIADVESDEIAPGRTGKLRITLENLADSFVKGISVQLNLSHLALAPIKTGSEKRIYSINARENSTIEFELIADSNAEGGIYKIPVTIRYSDSVGNEYVKVDYVTIKIGEKPDIFVSISEETYLKKGTAQKVVFEMVNLGLTKAKFLKVDVTDGDNYVFLQPTHYYIGDLDSDDFESATFMIVPDKSGDLNIPVELSYMDVNNKEYKETINVHLRVYSSSELKNLGIESGMSYGWIILLLLAAGVGYYYWKKKRLKK